MNELNLYRYSLDNSDTDDDDDLDDADINN